jgi:hypothetical protein
MKKILGVIIILSCALRVEAQGHIFQQGENESIIKHYYKRDDAPHVVNLLKDFLLETQTSKVETENFMFYSEGTDIYVTPKSAQILRFSLRDTYDISYPPKWKKTKIAPSLYYAKIRDLPYSDQNWEKSKLDFYVITREGQQKIIKELSDFLEKEKN